MKLHELFEAEERSVLSVMGKQDDIHHGDFYCYNNKLTSLEGAPSSVGGDFFCNGNVLTSLEGSPKEVGGSFICLNNKLTSLDGVSSIIGNHLNCMNNKLTSLHNIHKQIKHIGGYATFEDNPIKSHVLGLLLIDGLKRVYLNNKKVHNKKVQIIINKHLEGERDVFACQEELIEAGLDVFAQL